ncbi:hypothetical protein E1A91_A10G111900v1 [Gossypium mustelinum]|nr:hypothetical protein E1A91_A10G111900v1 [Gossypium mustelinum]
MVTLVPVQNILHRPHLHRIKHSINPVTKKLTFSTFKCQQVSYFISHTGHKMRITLHSYSPEAHRACKN